MDADLVCKSMVAATVLGGLQPVSQPLTELWLEGAESTRLETRTKESNSVCKSCGEKPATYVDQGVVKAKLNNGFSCGTILNRCSTSRS